MKTRYATTRRARLLAFLLSTALLAVLLPLAPAALAAGNNGIQLDGLDDAIHLGTGGASPPLGVTTFTLELWFKRTGAGSFASTGSGGNEDSIPLITKGRSQGDGSNIDTNYFLGIDNSTGEIEADFEDQAATNNNNPVNGATQNVSMNVWHHAAATYNGSLFCLYLDGVLDGTCTATTDTPRNDSIQQPAIGTAWDAQAVPVAAGRFAGQVDEVRIWSVARTQAEIQAAMGTPITTPTAGLLGRWAMDEGVNATAFNTAGSAGVNGNLVGGAAWVAGAPALDGGPPPTGNFGVQLDGLDDAIHLGTGGASPPLGVTTFTLELWFKRTGAGSFASTGSGGNEDSIPLITKGRSQGDGSNIDTNYFLGIDNSTGEIEADFEDQAATNNNNPVNGATQNVSMNVWHHAAATYNGSLFCLYLDGVLDGTCTATTDTPRNDSIQQPAIGTAWDAQAVPVAAGRFAGQVDEVRIWSVARTQAEIQAAMGTPITTPTAGLLGRWAMDEGVNATAFNTAGSAGVNGNLVGGAAWVAGAPALDGGPPPTGNFGVSMPGTLGSHVDLGPASTSLGATDFTLELWFKRTGAGDPAATSSSAQGLPSAIPLIAKGRSEEDATTSDVNYFLGIDSATGRLAADFEEGDLGTTPGANHGFMAATAVPMDVWQHAAVTYDGNVFRIYLNGVLDGTSPVINEPPRSNSAHRVGLGTTFNALNPITADGAFAGVIDEARIWNVARTGTEIFDSMNAEVISGTGLIGRWGMNEGTNMAVNGSVGGVNGSLVGGATWAPGAPLDLGEVPDAPVVVAPTSGATNVTLPATLDVTVTDPDSGELDVTFFGRQTGATAGQEFTLMTIPDTQYYSESAALSPIFAAQTAWIVSTQPSLNTVFTTHLGDITQNFDAIEVEWQRATQHMATLDNAGLKNNVTTGNHDMNGSNANFYDQYFPPSRYEGFPWYGGYLGDPSDGIPDGVNRLNKDNYELFSAGGMNFLIIHLEFDMPAYSTTWAQNVINAFPNRHVILSTHAFVNAGSQRPTSPVSRVDGQSAETVWNNLVVPNCRIFMVVNGHYHGEGRRTDNNSCGQPVFQLNSDYQERVNGGDGFLRYYTFQPSEDQIEAFSYSPTTNGGAGAFENDADSRFTLNWPMADAGTFTEIGTDNDVESGAHATVQWNGLNPGTEYEWYAVVSDGSQSTTGPTSTFTTEVPPPTPPVVDSVTINQANPRTNDTLTVSVQSHDINNDPITHQYQWIRNGSDIAGANASTLNLATAGNGNKGDAIAVRVTASDGPLTSIPVTSASVTILNTAPTATVGLSPATPRSTQAVTATATRADADGDTVTLTYVWKRNGAVVKTTAATSSLTDTLDLSTIGAVNGDVVSVEVTPNDGAANGTMVSASVTVDVPTVSAIPNSTFQVNGRVNALVYAGNRIYIGGDFTQLLGHNGEIVPRQYLAAVDATTGAPVAWDPGGDGVVYSLAASPDGNTIYAGGVFTHVGTLTRTRLAAINATTGAVTSWNPAASALVRTIVASGNRVYIGGAFANVTGSGQTQTPRARLAAFDATTGQVIAGWNPSASAAPRDMEMTSDGRLIVVGDFLTIGNVSSAYLAALDPTTGALLPWANRPSEPSQGAALGPNQLFVAVGAGAGGNQVIAYNLTNGNQQWVMTGDGDVTDVEFLNGVVYAGGHFDTMGGQARGRTAAFDPATGALRPWNPGVNTVVAIVTMLAAGDQLHIGGGFTLVNGVAQQRYASFSGPPAPNTTPVVDSVVINQATPGTNDTLSATVTSHDADADPLTTSYQWTRNGVDIAGATTPTLNLATAGNGDRGELIRLRVSVSDGTSSSPSVTSSPVTIVNTAPTATVSLDDDAPTTNETLTATVVRSDADGDAVSLTYLWTVNGATRQTTSTTSLTDTFNLSVAGNGDAGDSIVVTVTPNDGTANGTAAADTATVGSGAVPPIFADDFSSGNFTNWTANTRLTIDNAIGNPAASARAAVTNQSAFAYRTLPSTTATACASIDVNVASASSAVDLFRLRTAANGSIVKIVRLATGNLQIRSDVSTATLNSGVALGTGWHNVELCGTVGTTSTWDLYRDGLLIANDWAADSGTTPVGRLQIGDASAKTFTMNVDNARVDLVPGQASAPDTTGPTTPGQPTGSSPAAGTIRISWAASTDPTPPITYRIYRDGNPTSVGSTTATTFDDTGLTPGSNHSYTVDAVDGLTNASAMGPASIQITVSSGSPAIFEDNFSSGNFLNWTGNTLLTIDNATGSAAPPSARAQAANQAAWAFRTLTTTTMTACTSMNVNVASASAATDLFRLRTAANGAIIKVVRLATGNLQIRSDFGSTTINSGIALGTGWHSIELCGTVGGATTWDLFRDGALIVNDWGANTGTTAIGRIQIGDTVAKTYTANFDDVRIDQVPG